MTVVIPANQTGAISPTNPLHVSDISRSGGYDDGSQDGAVRAKIVRSDLERVPWRFGSAAFYTVVESNSTALLALNTAYTNSDGSGIELDITQSSASPLTFAEIWGEAPGRAIGFRYRRNQSTPDFSVMIDGRAFFVAGGNAQLFQRNFTAATYEGVFIVDDLPNTNHTWQILNHGSLSGTRTLVLYGLVLEKRLGYGVAGRCSWQGDLSGNLPTSSGTAVSVPIPAAHSNIRAITYQNTTVGAITVTILQGGSQFAVISVPANSQATYDFLAPIAVSQIAGRQELYTHSASATGVTCSVMGIFV